MMETHHRIRQRQFGGKMATTTFSEEQEVFDQHRDQWLGSNAGKFVVIQNSTVANGFFDTYADALAAGIRTFGVQQSFLIKQVWQTEPVYFID